MAFLIERRRETSGFRRHIIMGTLCLVLSVPLASPGSAGPIPLMTGTAVAKSVMKYFGREGTEEATEFLARQGGREAAERVSAAAIREGGEASVEQVTRLAAAHGPEAVRALDNVTNLGPVLSALDELPAAEVGPALARLSAGKAGRELAETVGRVGAVGLRCELKHPGVGGVLARALGTEGAEVAGRLTTDQAVVLARHADDLAKLPAAPRQGVMSLMRQDAERMVGFIGRFAADNPGKTLFTAATTTIVLAESERILGGDQIVFDADGNPVVVSTAGLAGRTLEAGGKAIGHVSVSYIQPLFLALLAFVGTFAVLFMFLKLYHMHQREKLATAGVTREPETIEAAAVKKKLTE